MLDVDVVRARRGDGRHRRRTGRSASVVWWVTVPVLAVLLATGICMARSLEESHESQDGGLVQSGGMVWITTDAEFVSLDEEVVLPPVEGIPSQPALQGSLAFSVASPLPAWSVRVEFEPTAGPGGPMDASRVMVRSPATGAEFVSVAAGIIVAHGQGPAPAQNLWLELQARPEWTDEAGLYQGLLHLTPIVSPEEHDSEIEHPGALRVMPGSATGLSSPFGPRLTVPVIVSVGPLTVVMTSETEFAIETGPGPGRYLVEPDLEVIVATNEEEWELLLDGTPFVCDEDEIPLERVEWSMLDAGGEPGIWTQIGDSNCLMSGYGERGVRTASFRLALDVIVTDIAGDYISEIHLVGSPR